MKIVIDNVNNADNPQTLGLDYSDFNLPFNDDLRVTGKKRANLTIGPVKHVERALLKTEEYGELLSTKFMFIH